MSSDPIRVTLLVVEALEKLGVPYLIGGSLASSVHGIARATMDADLVADLRSEHAEPLASLLRETFYVDAEMIREAVRAHRSFNVIHLETMFKVDVFILGTGTFQRKEFSRRRSEIIAVEPERTAYIATPEDIVLSKLDWYRQGGQVSDRQWRDVLGVLKVQGDRLDLSYMRRWAVSLGLEQLLERALAETGK